MLCTYRSTSGDDFLRASRQRIVLQAMLDKAKQSDLGSLTEMCKDIMSQISTNFTAKEIIQYATADYKISDEGDNRLPI